MSTELVYPDGRAEVTVPAGRSIAVFTRGRAIISQRFEHANMPPTVEVIATVEAREAAFGAFAAGAAIIITAGAAQVEYAVGINPVTAVTLQSKLQLAPGVLNATGTLTAAMMASGIVTSTTAAAVTATVDTGAIMDSALDLATNEAFDWSAIATGGFAFTVAVATGHSLVGSGVVAAGGSGRFRTRKTDVSTFVTYRL